MNEFLSAGPRREASGTAANWDRRREQVARIGLGTSAFCAADPDDTAFTQRGMLHRVTPIETRRHVGRETARCDDGAVELDLDG